MDDNIFCKLCGRRITDGMGHYVVRIEVFAADEAPEKKAHFSGESDFQSEVKKLLDEIAGTDPRELEEGVHKFFKFDLCRPCQREYIKNPISFRE